MRGALRTQTQGASGDETHPREGAEEPSGLGIASEPSLWDVWLGSYFRSTRDPSAGFRERDHDKVSKQLRVLPLPLRAEPD